VVNLDSLDSASLLRFWDLASMSTNAHAVRLFPGRPTGYRETTQLLGMYAANLYRARHATADSTRNAHLSLCRALYDTLPDYAKWSITV
jgi:hypothetical protein